MKKNMDTIQFESRREIGAIIQALEEWQDAHRDDDKGHYVQDLIGKLDVMSMEW